MLIKTILGKSKIHGIGLFADQDIKSGELVWKFIRGFDLEIPINAIAQLSEPAKSQFLKYSYISKKTRKYILCFDDARFFNHDDTPNVSCVSNSNHPTEEDVCIANRAINKGEELTCNYIDFEAGPYEEYVKHIVFEEAI